MALLRTHHLIGSPKGCVDKVCFQKCLVYGAPGVGMGTGLLPSGGIGLSIFASEYNAPEPGPNPNYFKGHAITTTGTFLNGFAFYSQSADASGPQTRYTTGYSSVGLGFNLGVPSIGVNGELGSTYMKYFKIN